MKAINVKPTDILLRFVRSERVHSIKDEADRILRQIQELTKENTEKQRYKFTYEELEAIREARELVKELDAITSPLRPKNLSKAFNVHIRTIEKITTRKAYKDIA